MKKGFSISALLTTNPVVIEGIDGRVYCGRTLTAALNAMRRGSWGVPAVNLRGYMRQVAKRVYGWNKIRISTRSVEAFVRDLIEARVITVHRRPPK